LHICLFAYAGLFSYCAIVDMLGRINGSGRHAKAPHIVFTGTGTKVRQACVHPILRPCHGPINQQDRSRPNARPKLTARVLLTRSGLLSSTLRNNAVASILKRFAYICLWQLSPDR
jgi:hypothetical protein